MKKVVSVILCAIIALACLPLFAGAANESSCDLPVIVLQGYSGSSLFLDLGEDSEQKVWGLSMESITDKIKENLGDLLVGTGGALVGDFEKLKETLGKAAAEMLEPLRMNGDGTSVYNLSVYPTGAENTRYSTLIERGEDIYIPEKPLSKMFAEHVGEENVFAFTTDWRQGITLSAAELDGYIQEVKALTGKSRVNLYGLSYGGQLGATYLYYYGEKGDVAKAVLNVPAIGGTKLATEVLTDDNFTFDVTDLIEFAEIGLMTEDEYEWLVEQFGFKKLNDALVETVREYLMPIILKFGSFWGLVPRDDYDTLKEEYLDPVEDSGLIAEGDEMHHNVMANMSEGLIKAQKAGVEVSIMTNTGRALAGGEKINSDYIVSVGCSSGAFCTAQGERFGADYAAKCITCSNPEHYHISPSMNIDASCAYLPENTWFINGQYHGQSYWDIYSRSLICKLLFTNDIKDIYSDPDYPQFEIAQNPADGIYARFDKTVSGFLTSKDSSLVVKNLSELHNISICSIDVNGTQLTFDVDKKVIIAAGESIEIPFSGELPVGDTSLVEIEINYVFYNRVPISKSRTIDFTCMSDEFASSVGKMPLSALAQPMIASADIDDESIAYSIDSAQISEPPAKTENNEIAAASTNMKVKDETQILNPQTGGTEALIVFVVLAFAAFGSFATVINFRKKEE